MRPTQAFDTFDELAYPVTTDELVASVGDVELDLPTGTETIGESFDRLAAETYADPWEAYTTFLSGLSRKAIGRRAYSDRDPPVHGFRERDPRAIDALLDDETRFDVDGPHCGICQHVKLVGDWDAAAYCELQAAFVDAAVDDVCDDYAPMAQAQQ